MSKLALVPVEKGARESASDDIEENRFRMSQKRDEDRELVRAAKSDAEAAGRLFDKYHDKIFRYIFHATLDTALTEDLTSNVFVSAFSNLQKFTWRSVPFSSWLYRIATNEVRAHRRRQKKAVVVLHKTDSFESGRAPALAAVEPLASDELIEEEERRRLRESVRELSPNYQEVISLRYFEDKSIEEIAEIVGKRRGAVKSQLHRGLVRLQEIVVRKDASRRERGKDNG